MRMFRKLVKKRNKSSVAAMERKKRSKAVVVFGIPLSILVCSLLFLFINVFIGLGFFRNPFAPVVTPSKTQEEYGMWASNNAYFTFMVFKD